MADLSDGDIDAASVRGAAARGREPRASSAVYDNKSGKVVVELTNGCAFSFPPRLVQGLEDAADVDLVSVTILGGGFGLHWEAADVDVSVSGLLAGIFGTRAFMARQGGQVSTARKASAARVNGAKGGRPRKVAG